MSNYIVSPTSSNNRNSTHALWFQDILLCVSTDIFQANTKPLRCGLGHGLWEHVSPVRAHLVEQTIRALKVASKSDGSRNSIDFLAPQQSRGIRALHHIVSLQVSSNFRSTIAWIYERTRNELALFLWWPDLFSRGLVDNGAADDTTDAWNFFIKSAGETRRPREFGWSVQGFGNTEGALAVAQSLVLSVTRNKSEAWARVARRQHQNMWLLCFHLLCRSAPGMMRLVLGEWLGSKQATPLRYERTLFEYLISGSHVTSLPDDLFDCLDCFVSIHDKMLNMGISDHTTSVAYTCQDLRSVNPRNQADALPSRPPETVLCLRTTRYHGHCFMRSAWSLPR